MDLVPDPLLLRKSGSAGNRTRASGSVAKNSDHKTREEGSGKGVYLILIRSRAECHKQDTNPEICVRGIRTSK
jgi:hypothetical protein